MSIRTDRRETVLERMADHLLATGLGGANLRALAAAAGTSDRMLLYYFADKDELLAATLERIAARLTAILDAAAPPVLQPFAILLPAVWGAVGSPALRPYMRLWLELAAGAARGRQPHGAVAAQLMTGFAEWTVAHLDAEPARRDAEAALLLAVMEGALFLDAVGRSDLADFAIVAAAHR